MKDNPLELFQAANQLSMSVSTLKRHIKRGNIEAVNFGAGKKNKGYKIYQASIDKFRNSRRINHNVTY